MKIKKIRCWRENLELTQPYTIAFNTITSVENLFVYLELENGQYGIGAGSPAEFITGEHIDASEAALASGLPPLLEGQDIRTVQALLRRLPETFAGMPAAQAAVDIALYDVWTKYLGIPLVALWGQRHHRLPTSITIGIKPLEATLEEARQRLAEGFRIIKLKTGRSEVEEDIEIYTRLKELAGPDILIRVDANQGYTVADFLRFHEATQHLAVEFYEQPFPPKHLDWMHQLPITLRRLAAADEDLHDPREAALLSVEPQPYGIYNIKLMKCGGIHAGNRIALIAADAGIDLMWGCMDESIVSITAALHLALASPATRYLDLDGSLDLAKDVVDGGFVLENGYLSVTDRPGLGVHLL